MMRFWKTCLHPYGILILSVVCFILVFHGNTAPAAEPDASLMHERPASDNQETGERFSLSRCIDTALAKNPDIAAARWDEKAAAARLDASRSALWPQVSIEGGYLKYLDSQRMIAARSNGEPGMFDDDLLRGDMVARMSLYTGGRVSSDARAASRLLEAERNKGIRTKEELVYQVTAVYLSLIGQQSLIDSLASSRKTLEEKLNKVRKLYENDKVARVDVLKTEVRLADVRQSILKEENAFAILRRVMFNLMGYEEVPEGARFDEVFALPSPVSADLDRLLETALKNRPDYLAARDRVEAQASRIKSARAGHLPNVNLVGTYGMRNAPSPEDRGAGTLRAEDVGSLGIFLTVPLFDGGRVSAKVREETAAYEALRGRMKKLELQIRQETETAVLDLRSSMSRFQATEKAVDQAKESLRIESLKYDLGKGSITDVLDAQTALVQSETNYCRSCIDYHLSMERLKLATGGTL